MAADRYRSVDEFLAAQPPPRREQVEVLRTLVREAAPELTEIVKWNSPDYTLDGVDRLTINAAGRGAGAADPALRHRASGDEGRCTDVHG